MRERPSHPINRPVFFIPLAVLATALIASLWQGARFLAAETAFNDWILRNFGPMFTISSVLFLALLAAIALSPFGGTIIGGAGAKPLLGRWRWFAVTPCTTIATGIPFLGVAEALFHPNEPPTTLGSNTRPDRRAHFAPLK